MSTTVLGISVSAALVRQWRGWFCPELQPFRTDLLRSDVAAALPGRQVDSTPEWDDTFFRYAGEWAWLSETEFRALRPSHQRALLAVRRRTVKPKKMPVWPSALADGGDQLMVDWVSSGQVRPSRHAAVPAGVWAAASSRVPRARLLAGSFAATGSGPNCFGTVMAAASDDDDLDGTQVSPDRFAAWLDRHTEPVTGTAHDDAAGVVFAWTEHGSLAHATVTIGGGWMLAKPSQSWSSPRLVSTVRETVHGWRFPGTRLSRHRIVR